MADTGNPQDLTAPIDGSTLPVTKTIVVEYTITPPETGATIVSSCSLNYPELDAGETIIACQLQAFNADEMVFDTTVVSLDTAAGIAKVEVERTDSEHEWTGDLILWCTYYVGDG